MNKPDWRYAPKWANWLAMDVNHDWYWYEDKPIWNKNLKVWDAETGRAEYASINKGSIAIKTLTPRPDKK